MNWVYELHILANYLAMTQIAFVTNLDRFILERPVVSKAK